MKKTIILSIILILCSSFVFASSIVRTIDTPTLSPGESTTITLQAQDPPSGNWAAIVHEYIPEGYTETSGKSSGGAIDAVFGTLTYTSLEYTLQAAGSATTVTLNGTYQFPSDPDPVLIGGDNQILISASTPQIKINEFLSHPSSGNEWIELYNPTMDPIDLSGWEIHDGASWVYPLSGTLNSHGYLVIYSTSKLNNEGDIIYLYNELNELIDKVTYGEWPTGITAGNACTLGFTQGKSCGRITDGQDTDVDNIDFQVFSTPTKGTTNGAPVDTTPPVISSINAVPSTTSAIVSWVTDENSNSTVYYGTTASLGAKKPSSSMVTSHSVSLTGLSSGTLYYYEVESCDASDNCADEEGTFTTTSTGNCDDDLQVNYIRGKITIDGSPAPARTPYIVTVISGNNSGATYPGEVDDSTVPSFLYGNGYFDTGDNICFSTDETFEITVEGTSGSITGIFENFGNGDFNDESSLETEDFIPIPHDPIVSLVYDNVVNEDELHAITINVDDPDLGNSWNYYKDGELLDCDTSSKTCEFTWTPTQEEVGVLVEFEFRVVDSTGREDTEIAHITVEEVNEAPVISGLPDQSLGEDSGVNGNLILLEDYASDEETPVSGLNYTIISETKTAVVDCHINGNNYLDCETQPEQSGTSTVRVEVSDGELTDSDSFTVTVNEVDDDAHWLALDDKTIDEDSDSGNVPIYEDITSRCIDVDSDIGIRVITTSPHFGIDILDDDLVIAYLEPNFNGVEEIVLDCNGIEESFDLTIAAVNDAPVIDTSSVTPDYDPIIAEDGSQDFSVTAEDEEDDPLSYTWHVNGVPYPDGNSFTYTGTGIVGRIEKEITVEVSDGNLTDEYTWTLTQTSCPIADTFTTTPADLCSLTEWELESVFPLIVENEHGKIEWLEPVDLTDVVDLDSNVRIEPYLTGVNTDEYPELDKNAKITLYDLSYSEEPAIKHSDDYGADASEITELCDFCTITSLTEPPTDDGTVVFEADHLEVFLVKANRNPQITTNAITTAYQGELYQYDVDAADEDGDIVTYSLTESPAGMVIDASGLIEWTPDALGDYNVEVLVSDGNGGQASQAFIITVLESPKLRIKNVEVDVDGEDDDVKDGDTIREEAKPLSEVEFKVEVENRFSKDDDIDMEDVELTVTIEDIDDGDEIDEDDEIGDISAGKDKTGKVAFTIPLKVDEDSYDVTIRIEGEDENNVEYEEEWHLVLEVEKDKHSLVLRNVDLAPNLIKCQKSANIGFTVTNIGSKDEDNVKVAISNSDLDLNKVFDSIELDEGSERSSDYEDSTIIRIDDLEGGAYPITLKAYYDGNLADQETVELTKEECTEPEPKPRLKKAEEVVVVEKEAPLEIPMYYSGPKVGPSAPTVITFRDSSTYVFLMVLLIILLSGAALFAFGVLISMARKK